MTPRALACLLAALAATAFVARPAAACSVCLAGDPQFATHGAASQPAGGVAVYFEMRDFAKESGGVVRGANERAAAPSAAPAPALPRPRHAGHDHADDDLDLPVPGAPGADVEPESRSTRERNDSRRLDLYAAWTPLDRVTLTLNLPWAMNSIEEGEGGDRTHYSISGFGDVALAVSGVVWRNRPVLPSAWLELRLWGKAPTGRDERRVDGVLDSHAQAGTGSWDYGFGAAAVHRFSWGALYGSVFHRRNQEGGLDYEYGDVLLATAALEVPLGHALGVRALDRVTPGAGFDFRWAGRDRADGDGVGDTGGSILYATPSLRFALPAFGETHRAWLRTGVQIPLTDAWLYDEQDEGVVWSVGVGYGF